VVTNQRKTFPLDVPDIGKFRIFTRCMQTYLDWQAELNNITGGIDREAMSDEFQQVAAITASLRTRIAIAPNDWDIESLDFMYKEDAEKLVSVYSAINEADALFRGKRVQPSEENSEDPANQDSVVVPEPLQAAVK